MNVISMYLYQGGVSLRYNIVTYPPPQDNVIQRKTNFKLSISSKQYKEALYDLRWSLPQE